MLGCQFPVPARRASPPGSPQFSAAAGARGRAQADGRTQPDLAGPRLGCLSACLPACPAVWLCGEVALGSGSGRARPAPAPAQPAASQPASRQPALQAPRPKRLTVLWCAVRQRWVLPGPYGAAKYCRYMAMYRAAQWLGGFSVVNLTNGVPPARPPAGSRAPTHTHTRTHTLSRSLSATLTPRCSTQPTHPLPGRPSLPSLPRRLGPGRAVLLRRVCVFNVLRPPAQPSLPPGPSSSIIQQPYLPLDVLSDARSPQPHSRS